MQIDDYARFDVPHVPGTIIGLYPIKRFDTLEAAEAVTATWDNDGTWSIEPVIGSQGDVLWYVIALRDDTDKDIVMLL